MLHDCCLVLKVGESPIRSVYNGILAYCNNQPSGWFRRVVYAHFLGARPDSGADILVSFTTVPYSYTIVAWCCTLDNLSCIVYKLES